MKKEAPPAEPGALAGGYGVVCAEVTCARAASGCRLFPHDGFGMFVAARQW